jgi:hypothetical protein
VCATNAQPGNNLRKRLIAVTPDSVQVDTLSIIPNSVRIFDKKGNTVDPNLIRVNYGSAWVYFNASQNGLPDSIWLEYRVFPILFEKNYFKRNYRESLSPDSLMDRNGVELFDNQDENTIFSEGIKSRGSFSRGINFGNNQDLSVRSGMNIQLSGELAPNLFIEGAISDRDIPLQPQGNTAKIQEFDRIFLKVFNPTFAVMAGDIDLTKGNVNSPLRFKRNVQGIAYQTKINTSKTDTISVEVAASVPKGKFARSSITGSDGNQGPYRLSGANNESYIIILSGSERVFVDGILMQRGEENQYTIDYNTAELTFTPLMLITRFSRIVVEFEYSERSYARFVTYASVAERKKSWQWNVSAFSESDAKNQPFDQQLSDEQKQLLAGIGDNLSLAYTPQIDSVEFNPEVPLYEKIDTLSSGILYTIYRHSTNPQTASYRVVFTSMGQGKGNYIPNFASANGRTYRWVAPVNGISQGSFEPIKRLVAPRKQQMLTAGISKNWGVGSDFSVNAAISNNDLNTFSELDSHDNTGQLVMGSVTHRLPLIDSLKMLRIGGNFLYSTHGFRYVDRIRPVEFERDWAIVSPLTGKNEQYGRAWLEYGNLKFTRNNIEVEGLRTDANFEGIRATISGILATKHNSFVYSSSFLSASDTISNKEFLRGKFRYSRQIGLLKAGLEGEAEDLRIIQKLLGEYLPQSHSWQMAGAFISTPDTLSERIALAYNFRNDYQFTISERKPFGQSQKATITAVSERPTTGNIKLSLGLNQFKPLDTLIAEGKREETFLGRLDYSKDFWKKSWQLSVGYDLGSGLEPANEYYFVEVPAGQGVYGWNDYNSNGVKELNEFEIANFSDEARYIRVNFPGTQMVRVKTNSFSFRSNINPALFFDEKVGFARVISILSNQTSFIVARKNRFEKLAEYANPFTGNLNDTLIVNSLQQFRNSLALNRNSRKLGAEYIFTSNISSQLQANGFEQKQSSGNRLKVWFEFYTGYTFTVEGYTNQTQSSSQFFPNRNFEINGKGPFASIRYNGESDFSVEIGVEQSIQKALSALELLTMKKLFVKVDYSVAVKTLLMANYSLISNKFEGESSSPVAYEMLKGLQPGINSTWELMLRKRVSKVIEIEAGYHGRNVGKGKYVHTGSMLARALF